MEILVGSGPSQWEGLQGARRERVVALGLDFAYASELATNTTGSPENSISIYVLELDCFEIKPAGRLTENCQKLIRAGSTSTNIN